MRKTLFKMVVLSAVLIPVTAFAADWPRFLGPNGDGISPETGINKDWARKPPKMLWKVRMSDGGYAGPSVADGKVFIIDHKGSNDIVRAINIKTGKDVWTSPYQDSPRENRGFARSTPTVAGGGLYTLSRLGVLNCFLLKNGTKVWSLDIKKEFRGRLPKWQMAMSPFVDGDKLILVPGQDDLERRGQRHRGLRHPRRGHHQRQEAVRGVHSLEPHRRGCEDGQPAVEVPLEDKI